MQKASASIRYICMIYVANASIAIRSLTSEMKPRDKLRINCKRSNEIKIMSFAGYNPLETLVINLY